MDVAAFAEYVKGRPEWQDESRIHGLFADFGESRDENELDWDSRMEFWRAAILGGARQSSSLVVEPRELTAAFTRDGIAPMGLNVVLEDLVTKGELRGVDQYAQPETWSAWLWSSVAGSAAPTLTPTSRLVVCAAVEEKLASIMTAIGGESPVGSIVLLDEFASRFELAGTELEVVLRLGASKSQLYLVEDDYHGVQAVKVGGGVRVLEPPCDKDKDVAVLLNGIRTLSQRLEFIESTIDGCTELAKKCLKEGARGRAAFAIKKRSVYQKAWDRVSESALNLERAAVEIAAGESAVDAVAAMAAATGALNAVNDQLEAANADAVLEGMENSMADVAAVSDALASAGLGDTDMDELEAELAALTLDTSVASPSTAAATTSAAAAATPADGVSTGTASTAIANTTPSAAAVAPTVSDTNAVAQGTTDTYAAMAEALNELPSAPTDSPQRTATTTAAESATGERASSIQERQPSLAM